MIVIVTVTLSGVHRDDAAGPGNGAAHVFELDGGVVEMEAIAQHPVEPGEDAIALRGRHVLDQDVAAQRMRARTEAPDVQIVDVEYAIDAAHRGDDVIEIDAARQAFEQNIQGFTNDVPCRPDDQERRWRWRGSGRSEPSRSRA